jgi:hypothetical protein
MRGIEMSFELFVVTMAHNLKTLDLKSFAMIWVLSISCSHWPSCCSQSL